MMKRIAVFASGSGTNTQNIIEHFQDSEVAKVVLVLSNKKDAKVLERAQALKTKGLWFTKDQLFSKNEVLKTLLDEKVDFIVLAGFLLKFPENILKEFRNKVINIHPALLPKYGGKGMYGHYVHQAVVANKERETGITIHYVDENYDEGAIIFQACVAISEKDTPKEVASKVHQLEYDHFPKIIESVLTTNASSSNLQQLPDHE